MGLEKERHTPLEVANDAVAPDPGRGKDARKTRNAIPKVKMLGSKFPSVVIS
jgi:hypothetical protein